MKDNLKKTLIIVIIPIILALSLAAVKLGTASTKKVEYYEIIELFENNEVSECVINLNSGELKYNLRSDKTDTKDKNSNSINKISCSEFWKGKNSYIDLQDKFYSYIKKCGFDLERGRNRENEHIPIEALKIITNHEVQKYELKSQHEEREIESNNIKVVKEDYRRVIKKFNTLAKQYTKFKVTCDSTLSELERVKSNYDNLEKEYNKEVKKCHYLKKYISKTFEYISILMNWPIERVRKQIDNFIESFKNEKEKNENEKYNDKERIR